MLAVDGTVKAAQPYMLILVWFGIEAVGFMYSSLKIVY